MSDLNEIKNHITQLLYGTTAPQGEVWKAIHEIEAQYQEEIKRLALDLNLSQRELNAAVAGMRFREERIEKLEEKISAMQNHIDHHLEVIESLLAKNERLHDENSQLRSEKKA